MKRGGASRKRRKKTVERKTLSSQLKKYVLTYVAPAPAAKPRKKKAKPLRKRKPRATARKIQKIHKTAAIKRRKASGRHKKVKTEYRKAGVKHKKMRVKNKRAGIKHKKVKTKYKSVAIRRKKRKTRIKTKQRRAGKPRKMRKKRERKSEILRKAKLKRLEYIKKAGIKRIEMLKRKRQKKLESMKKARIKKFKRAKEERERREKLIKLEKIRKAKHIKDLRKARKIQSARAARKAKKINALKAMKNRHAAKKRETVAAKMAAEIKNAMTAKAKKAAKKPEAQTKGKEEVSYFKTDIPGFDSLLKSGIPSASSVLIEGGPGSGKTIFCLQTAYNACRQGKKVLYMSFEEPEQRLRRHMKNFGWDTTPYEKKGTFMIKRFDALDIARSVEALLSEAKKELLIDVQPILIPAKFKPDVVLVDSLTSIASAFSGEESRFRIYMEQLFRYLEYSKITSFLIREVSNPTHIGKNFVEKYEAVSFLSDGIIILYSVAYPNGTRGSAVEVLKMRGSSINKKIVRMDITGRGLVVHPDVLIKGNIEFT